MRLAVEGPASEDATSSTNLMTLGNKLFVLFGRHPVIYSTSSKNSGGLEPINFSTLFTS